MRIRSAALIALAVASSVAWTRFHLEIVASFPDEDEVVAEAPETIWIEFTAAPDLEQTSFAVRGPEGLVQLGDMAVGEKPEVVQARVTGPMPAGTYTVSWVGAPADDHPVRGRYDFSVGAGR